MPWSHHRQDAEGTYKTYIGAGALPPDGFTNPADPRVQEELTDPPGGGSARWCGGSSRVGLWPGLSDAKWQGKYQVSQVIFREDETYGLPTLN